jgi:hypothetical protein
MDEVHAEEIAALQASPGICAEPELSPSYPALEPVLIAAE